jgi:hypothetical protein
VPYDSPDEIQLRWEIKLKFGVNKLETLSRVRFACNWERVRDRAIQDPGLDREKPGEIGEEQHQLIIKGRTLGNCNEWEANVTGLQDSIEGRWDIMNSPGQIHIRDG